MLHKKFSFVLNHGHGRQLQYVYLVIFIQINFWISVYFPIILYDVTDHSCNILQQNEYSIRKKSFLSVGNIGRLLNRVSWGVIMVMSWSFVDKCYLDATKIISFFVWFPKWPVTLDSWCTICYVTISLYCCNPLLQWKP